jgi:GyrI-like small molecule binding domain
VVGPPGDDEDRCRSLPRTHRNVREALPRTPGSCAQTIAEEAVRSAVVTGTATHQRRSAPRCSLLAGPPGVSTTTSCSPTSARHHGRLHPRGETAGTRFGATIRHPRRRPRTTVHAGPHDDIDVTYAALASYVSEQALQVAGPVREIYHVGPRDTDDRSAWRTEIGWPIFETTTEA